MTTIIIISSNNHNNNQGHGGEVRLRGQRRPRDGHENLTPPPTPKQKQ